MAMYEDFSACRARLTRGQVNVQFGAASYGTDTLERITLAGRIEGEIKKRNCTDGPYEIEYTIPEKFKQDMIDYFTNPSMGYTMIIKDQNTFIIKW